MGNAVCCKSSNRAKSAQGDVNNAKYAPSMAQTHNQAHMNANQLGPMTKKEIDNCRETL